MGRPNSEVALQRLHLMPAVSPSTLHGGHDADPACHCSQAAMCWCAGNGCQGTGIEDGGKGKHSIGVAGEIVWKHNLDMVNKGTSHHVEPGLVDSLH